MQLVKIGNLPRAVRDAIALDAIPRRRQYKRVESDSFTDDAGKLIRRGDKIRISGERVIYTFVRHVRRGRREWIDVFSDKTGWRSLNVGRRYRYCDVIVPRYQVRIVKRKAVSK